MQEEAVFRAWVEKTRRPVLAAHSVERMMPRGAAWRCISEMQRDVQFKTQCLLLDDVLRVGVGTGAATVSL